MKKDSNDNSRLMLTKVLAEIVLPITENFQVKNLINCDKLKLIELANINFMSFSLYQGIVNNRLEQYFTEQQLNYLQEFYELNKQRNTDFLHELREIIFILNEHNIEPVLLKGAVALADNWYGGMGARFMRDIDFLVPEHQVDEAFHIVKGMGYQEVHELDDDHADNEAHHHCPALHKPNSALVIEVHSKPLSLKTKGVLTSQQVFAEKVPTYSFNLGHCYIPSPSHCLLIAVMHTEISHGNRERGSLLLRHALDVAIILSKYNDINFQKVEFQLSKQGFIKLLPSYLFVLKHFFNLNTSQNYLTKIPRDDAHLNRVINNMSKKPNVKKYRFNFYKRMTIHSFSKQRISSRYSVKKPLLINLYRVVNLARLILKFSAKSSWNLKESIINSETSRVKVIGD